MKKSPVRFVYFDVGGVLVDDFSGNDKWAGLLDEIGVHAGNKELFESLWLEYHRRFCIDMDIDDFCSVLKLHGFTIRDGYSLLVEGFVNRFYKNEFIWPIVASVPVERRGLLTNMYPRMLDEIKRQKLFAETDWGIECDSSVIRLQKPDQDIYHHALEKTGLRPEEVLFVENTKANVETADQLGWQTFHYDSSDHEGSCARLESILKGSFAPILVS